MKDICAIYLKEDKSIIKKLSSKLESDGISCWVSTRDFNQEDNDEVKEIIDKSRILLLALNNNTSKNKQIINILEIALENDLEVIPFVTGKVDSDLYSEYFFYKFSWVDAYEDEFDEAYEVLLEAIDELSDDKPRKKATNKKSIDNENVNKKLYIAAIAAVMIVIAFFAYNYIFVNEHENAVVGEWHLSDYSDNLKRTPLDSINIFSQIEAMKKSAVINFNDDNSFERIGFSPEPQIGQWEIDGNAKYLYLIPIGSQTKDKLNIETLTDNLLVLVVNEKLPTATADSVKVNTRLTFTK